MSLEGIHLKKSFTGGSEVALRVCGLGLLEQASITGTGPMVAFGANGVPGLLQKQTADECEGSK